MTRQIVFRVVKLGGSLLDDPGLCCKLSEWMRSDPARGQMIVTGGGSWVDGVREAATRFALSEEFCHWLCIDLLDQTAQLASQVLDLPLAATWQDARKRIACGGAFVFAPTRFLKENEADLDGCPLPHDWSVTTDSIAARIAGLLMADELVLLKSSPPPPSGDVETWAGADYVDAYFPKACSGLSVRAVNLRQLA